MPFDPFAQFAAAQQSSALRKRLLGLQEPLQPEELVQALMESSARRGVDVPPANWLGLLQSASAQPLGGRRLFTETGDLLSRRVPFTAPGITPTGTELQRQVELASMPPSRQRLLEEAEVGKALRAAEGAPDKELQQKVLIKKADGSYQYQSLKPGQTLRLAKGDELVSPREPGGAVSESQTQRSYFSVLNRAQSQAAMETKLRYPSSEFSYNTMTGQMVIGEKTPPEALQYFQDSFKQKGRAMSKGLPDVQSLFNQAFPEEQEVPKPLSAQEEIQGMPDAIKNKGRIIKDTVSGKRYKSNGLTWEEIK